MKKHSVFTITLLVITVFLFSFCINKKHPRVLVFSKTSGFHHSSIPDGIAAIQKIGKEQGFAVDTTTDSTLFRKDLLKKYAAVIFLSTTGNVLGPDQQKVFEHYIEKGGGFVGVHAATDTEYDWAWYGKMVGGYFLSHPKPQEAKLKIIDHSHPATKDLPDTWTKFDEWYNFKNLNKDVHVLMTIDETSYEGGKNGNYHPMSWWQNVGDGRMFYTALGHTEQSYTDPLFLKHLTGGILFAIDRKKL
jgi:type 1 glutamine amidotransferase